jgi:hypothetical protein
MAVMFPLDDNGHPILVLGFNYRGTQKPFVGTISARHGAPIPVRRLARGPIGGASIIGSSS